MPARSEEGSLIPPRLRLPVWLGIAAIGGGVAAVSMPPYGFWPALPLGLTVLVLSVVAVRGRSGGLVAWAGGAAYFALSLSWLVEPFQIDAARQAWMAPFALVFMAAGLALFWGLAGLVVARFAAPWARALGFAAALGLAEWLRGHVLTGFPWALPAYGLAETEAFGTLALLGPFGLTFILFSAAAAPHAFARPLGRIAGLGAGVTALAALFAFAPAAPPQIAGGPVVRVVQPNAPQALKWRPDKAPVYLARALRMTASTGDHPALVVWPETAITDWLEDAGPVLATAGAALPEGATLILGARRSDRGRIHNSLVHVTREGTVAARYDKERLVPFGEYFPLGEIAARFGLHGLAASDGSGFSAGQNQGQIETGIGKAIPLICYEAIFPAAAASAAADRPRFLVQITNDAWFGLRSGPQQHFAQARARAIEQGLPMVRAANTGISAIIDAQGKVVTSVRLNETGFAEAPLPAALPPTLYARFGDLPFLAVVLSLLALTLVLGRTKPD